MAMKKIESLLDLLTSESTEQDCIDYFKENRGKGKVVSPYDPTSKVGECKSRKNGYKCKNTGKYFNAKTGTIFENSKIPLKKWFFASYFFSLHKKGISSHQLARDICVTTKTAGFMVHRLRHASGLPLFKDMLKDFVEIDETYVGGSNPNRHGDKKVPHSQGRSWKDKTPTLVMVERGGNAIAQIVPNVKQKTLEPIIRKNIKEGSNVYTDEGLAYKDLNKGFNHQIVNHKNKQYVNGKASTNLAENFNSHLKRGIQGTYHGISRKHAQKYVDEFTFRYNTRKYSTKDSLDLILSSTVGKRLTYKQLTS